MSPEDEEISSDEEIANLDYDDLLRDLFGYHPSDIEQGVLAWDTPWRDQSNEDPDLPGAESGDRGEDQGSGGL